MSQSRDSSTMLALRDTCSTRDRRNTLLSGCKGLLSRSGALAHRSNGRRGALHVRRHSLFFLLESHGTQVCFRRQRLERDLKSLAAGMDTEESQILRFSSPSVRNETALASCKEMLRRFCGMHANRTSVNIGQLAHPDHTCMHAVCFGGRWLEWNDI